VSLCLIALQDDDMTIVRIMLQVARVLQWLHDRGLFHMDLKTLNILADLTNPSKPKAMLADLGLAIYSEYDWFKSGKGTGTYLW
jgi:serine/threonine protein kinase